MTLFIANGMIESWQCCDNGTGLGEVSRASI